MKLMIFIALQSLLLVACGPVRKLNEESKNEEVVTSNKDIEGYFSKTDGSSYISLYKEGRFSNGAYSKLFMVCKSTHCGWGTRPESLKLHSEEEGKRTSVIGGSIVTMGMLSANHKALIEGVYEHSAPEEKTAETVLTEFQGHPYIYVEDLTIDSYRPHLEDVLSIVLDNGHVITEKIQDMNSRQRVARRRPTP